MTINLITFASILHKQVTIRSSHEAVLSELEKYFTVKFVDYRDIHQLTKDDFSIIFIATGGVERLVMQCFESLPALPLFWPTECKIPWRRRLKSLPGCAAGA